MQWLHSELRMVVVDEWHELLGNKLHVNLATKAHALGELRALLSVPQ